MTKQLCPLQTAREEGVRRIKDSSTVWNTPEKLSKDRILTMGMSLLTFYKTMLEAVAVSCQVAAG